jgi:hypothetical protein
MPMRRMSRKAAGGLLTPICVGVVLAYFFGATDFWAGIAAKCWATFAATW